MGVRDDLGGMGQQAIVIPEVHQHRPPQRHRQREAPSRKPLKLSAPFRPVSPATSWNVAVLVTVSACNQDESTTGAAAVCSACAPAMTGTTTMDKTDRNLTIRPHWGEAVQHSFPRHVSRRDKNTQSLRETRRGNEKSATYLPSAARRR